MFSIVPMSRQIFGVKHVLNHFLKTLFSAENVHNLKKVNMATIVVCAIFPINHKTPEALNLGRFVSGTSVSVMSLDTASHIADFKFLGLLTEAQY